MFAMSSFRPYGLSEDTGAGVFLEKPGFFYSISYLIISVLPFMTQKI